MKKEQCCTCKHFVYLAETYYAGECRRADDEWYSRLSGEQRLFVDRVTAAVSGGHPAFYVTNQWVCADYQDKYQGDESAQQDLL